MRSEQEAPTQSSLAFFARVQFEFSGDSIRSNTPRKIWRAVNVLVNYTKGQPKQISSVDIRESQMGGWGVGGGGGEGVKDIKSAYEPKWPTRPQLKPVSVA